MKSVLVGGTKGGIGKSTVAVDLARRLAKHRSPVAFLDADLDNPAVARYFGLPNAAGVTFAPDARYVPWPHDGVEIFSQALIGRRVKALAWPGEEHRNLIADAVRHTRWSPEARLMVVDLPAGSSDELLAAVQAIGAPNCGMLLVTVPRQLDAAERSVQTALQLEVPVLGVVQNLSSYRCPNPSCGMEWHPFGAERAASFCDNYGVPFLGELPVHGAIAEAMDTGTPIPPELAGPIVRACEEVLRWA